MDSESAKCSGAAAAGDSIRVQIEKAHNFMRQYRDPESRELKKLSANQFMDVWSHYDKDGKFPFILKMLFWEYFIGLLSRLFFFWGSFLRLLIID